LSPIELLFRGSNAKEGRKQLKWHAQENGVTTLGTDGPKAHDVQMCISRQFGGFSCMGPIHYEAKARRKSTRYVFKKLSTWNISDICISFAGNYFVSRTISFKFLFLTTLYF
jgi:hypothetical protein